VLDSRIARAHPQEKPMTMPLWSTPTLLAGLLFGLHYATLRASSGHISDGLGAFLLEGTAAVGILVLLLLNLVPSTTATQATGVFWSCVSGLCISGVSVLLYAALRLGAPVASVGTIVLGCGLVVAALLSLVFFGETFTARRAIGVLLGMAAIVLLASEKS
jgi:uncharacterized membrane protein